MCITKKLIVMFELVVRIISVRLFVLIGLIINVYIHTCGFMYFMYLCFVGIYFFRFAI